MKDYSIAVEAIKTAETAVEMVVENNSMCVKNKGEDVINSITMYLSEVLKNADFPEISIYSSRYYGTKGDGLPLGEIRLDSGKGKFIHNGEYYDAQFYIIGTHNVAGRIFINKYKSSAVCIGDDLLPIACYLWKDLKGKIDPAIDLYLRRKNYELKEKLNKSQTIMNIVNNFEV